MPTWTDPVTVVDGSVITASLWNLEIRDKLRALGLTDIQDGEIILGDGAGSFSVVDGSGLAAQPGTILEYPGSTPPDGYLHADGSLVSRTTYSGLFAAIGTLFGTGAGDAYAINATSDHLYRVDVVTPANSVDLGAMPAGSWGSLGGVGSILYATETNNGHLYRVDVVTPANSVDLGAMPAGSTYWSLGGVGSILYAINTTTDHLHRVDVVTPANSVDLGAMPITGNFAGLGGVLNDLYTIERQNDRLYRVDVVTPGNSQNLGTLSGSGIWTGLGGVVDVLYAMTNNDRLYRVDVDTLGNSQDLGAMPSGTWSSLGGVDTVTDSFRLPSVIPADPRFIGVIKI